MIKKIQLAWICIVISIGFTCLGENYRDTGLRQDPYNWQVGLQFKMLKSNDPSVRAAALENLSHLRDYKTSDKIIPFLKDSDPVVRREAAMNLGWTGNRKSLKPLLDSLNDVCWTVSQAAAISLQNLTGQEIPFDALADDTVKSEQIAKWKSTVEDLTGKELLKQLNELYKTNDKFFRKGDLIRAIGSMDVKAADPLLIEKLTPYIKKRVRDNRAAFYEAEGPSVASRSEKIYVQSLIRSLGRLGSVQGKQLLIKLLDVPQWAAYAADALGDIGGEDAAAVLIKHYPDYAFKVNGRVKRHSNYGGLVKRVHSSDDPKLTSDDRMPRVAHAILQTLCRIEFSSKENIEALADIVPNILATFPTMFDATMVYEFEPYQMFAAYLLEKCGLRQAAVDTAFMVLKKGDRTIDDRIKQKAQLLEVINDNVTSTRSPRMPYAGTILMACCMKKEDIPLLLELLEHENGWIKIDAARTLLYMGSQEAIPVLIKLLTEAKDDADYGYDMDFKRFRKNNVKEKKLPGAGYDEYSDPSPRFKEAFIMALGGLKAEKATSTLIKYLNNNRNVAEIQYAAARALYQIGTPEALEALRIAEAKHPFECVRQVARESVWRHGLKKIEEGSKPKTRTLYQLPVPEGDPKEIVFIKGVMDPGNHEQISSDQTGYSTTDGGPTYRLGNNIFKLKLADPEGSLKQLSNFKDGWVADIEVSYDGKKILFCRRGPGEGAKANPWWHIYEMNADGTGLRQITDGPYHDIQPNYMPDGRIVFSTSRLGMRDEYHGYAATGLAVMNDDGTDIHLIGFNLGRDAEPVIGDDGKILFTRLELFYSRMKTEWNLLTAFTDGTNPVTLYGPERRKFWRGIRGASSIAAPRHRVLRITQPQPWGGSHYLINSFSGPMITGPGHSGEKILLPNNDWAVTTPYRISEKKLLVAAGKRPLRSKKPEEKKKKEKAENKKKKTDSKTSTDIMAPVDHGLFFMDVDTGKLTLIYNDPKWSDFEARPLQPRKIPRILPEGPFTRSRDFSGKIYCNSVFTTRQSHVKERGKYIRIIEGEPTVSRHQTHMNGGIAWRNHGGAIGRDWGTVPLATDGSFALEVPSDRMFHLQVLDSDKNVVGNELLWQYTRPGEVKSCVGCHETPDSTPKVTSNFPKAHKQAPIQCFPHIYDMKHRAKLWFKGWVPDEREERMHTVNSINIIGRQ